MACDPGEYSVQGINHHFLNRLVFYTGKDGCSGVTSESLDSNTTEVISFPENSNCCSSEAIACSYGCTCNGCRLRHQMVYSLGGCDSGYKALSLVAEEEQYNSSIIGRVCCFFCIIQPDSLLFSGEVSDYAKRCYCLC